MKVVQSKDTRGACRAFTESMLSSIAAHAAPFFTVAVSGGSTALFLFACWREEYFSKMPWQRIRLFWVDERYVPANSAENNYYQAERSFLHLGLIPSMQIFRIRTDMPIDDSCKMYRSVIDLYVEKSPDGFPCFDLIFLGVGDDGHIASLLPLDYQRFIQTTVWIATTFHPERQESRITLTYPLLNHASQLFFLVVGDNKRPIVAKMTDQDSHPEYPFGCIQMCFGVPVLFTDVSIGGLHTDEIRCTFEEN